MRRPLVRGGPFRAPSYAVSKLSQASTVRGFEKFGETVWPSFSGLVLVEALKRLYAETPGTKSRLVMRPSFSAAPIRKPAANRDTKQ